MILAWPTRGASLLLLAAYFVLYGRIQRYAIARGWSASNAWLFACSCILAKLPNALGLFTFWFRRIARHVPQIIEYKGASTSASAREFSASMHDKD